MLGQLDILPFVDRWHDFRILGVEQLREGTFAFERYELGGIDDLFHCQVSHRFFGNCIDIDVFEEGSDLLEGVFDLSAIHACLFAVADGFG